MPQQEVQRHRRPQLLPVLGDGDEAAPDEDVDDGAELAGGMQQLGDGLEEDLEETQTRRPRGSTANEGGADDNDGGGAADADDVDFHRHGERRIGSHSDGPSASDSGGSGGGIGGSGGGSGGAAKLAKWIESGSYGRFIGITPFFNPGRHQNKVDNFRKFRQSVAAQGLQMLCVELVFGENTPFQLLGPDGIAGTGASPTRADDDAQGSIDDGGVGDGSSEGGATSASASSGGSPDCDILVQRRTTSENTLWQKERLMNIALENLPHSVTKVMWLDSDLIFLNDEWVMETSDLLDKFPVVQPFAWMTYLPAGANADFSIEQLAALPLGQGVGGVYHSAGLGLQSFPDMCFRSNFLLGHPGFAWAARREVIAAAGFYDRSIIGGGDRIMLNGFTGHYVGVSRKMPPAMADDVRAFGRKLTPLVGPTNVSYTPGVVLHIWHGNRADRDYTHRYQILLTNHYDPVRDVRVTEDGVLAWSSEKPRLHRQVTEYFNNRKEGPKPNNTLDGLGGAGEETEGDDAWSAQRKSLSRPVRSFLGYHCGRPDYRASCKLAFRLWGDTLRATQLQMINKQLRQQQEEAQKAVAASREAAQKRSRDKRSKMKAKKQHRQQSRRARADPDGDGGGSEG